ncbi:hypothetical protein SAMN04487934_10296 [Eubacterium ruminantium]|nr:hypothetical protein SAMN04487934_10296 [Eubacterium ruminantium]
MIFSELPSLLRGCLILWGMLLFLGYAFNVMLSVQLKRSKQYIFSTILLGISIYMVFQIMLSVHNHGKVYVDPNVYVLIPGFALATVLFAIRMVRIFRWMKNNISGLSVKESFDSLPTGLCFFLESGLPRMTNKAMESLSMIISGKVLTDAGRFWLRLKYGEYPGCLIAGDTPVYLLPDGRVFSFILYEMTVEKNHVYELIGNDITEEYSVKTRLENEKAKARDINERLRILNRSITRITAEKEVLNAKIRIHNDIGNLLLYSKSYLTDKESDIKKDKLISMWRLNNSLFEQFGPEVWQSTYVNALEEAEKLGVNVRVSGDISETAPLKEIVETAMRVEVNNTLRHAHGRNVFVDYSEGEEYRRIIFRNDGKPPAEAIREGGGIGNLRKMVEQSGGSLTVTHEPEFCMTIMMPVENI